MAQPNRRWFEDKVGQAKNRLAILKANLKGTEGDVRREIEAQIHKAELAVRDAQDDLDEFSSNPDNK